MAIPTVKKREEYIGYAEYCVKLARQIDDPESRGVLREMAAEWLKVGRLGRPLVMIGHLSAAPSTNTA